MSLMQEYINKGLSAADLEVELQSLIKKYNELRNTYLMVFVTDFSKPIPDLSLNQSDFFIIADILRNVPSGCNFDMYLETPGGSGEAAEEIVNFLHSHFNKISFVVSGEAKSAGTIMVLSGHEILMTKTGSLGPIDAQMKIGRSVVSAYDYMEWIQEKQNEASKTNVLNPFDAIMVAQISPGELKGVHNALHFAKDIVIDWLQKHKFKEWNMTATRKELVTTEMKKERAEKVADALINHGKWRSHGRSIKIEDLEALLQIVRVDEDAALQDIVYRIQTVCRMLFLTSAYKLFFTQDVKILKQAVPAKPMTVPSDKQIPDVASVKINCSGCKAEIPIYAKFAHNPQIDDDYQKKGFKPFPANNKFLCACGTEIDLSAIRNELEIKTGRRVLVG